MSHSKLQIQHNALSSEVDRFSSGSQVVKAPPISPSGAGKLGQPSTKSPLAKQLNQQFGASLQLDQWHGQHTGGGAKWWTK